MGGDRERAKDNPRETAAPGTAWGMGGQRVRATGSESRGHARRGLSSGTHARGVTLGLGPSGHPGPPKRDRRGKCGPPLGREALFPEPPRSWDSALSFLLNGSW